MRGEISTRQGHAGPLMGGIGGPDAAGSGGREGGQGMQKRLVVRVKRRRYLHPDLLQRRPAERRGFRHQRAKGQVIGQGEDGAVFPRPLQGRAALLQDAMDMGELIGKLNGMGERVIFLGDGVPVYEKQIAEKMTVPYDLAPAHVNRQRAASVAALGAVYFAEGKTETAMEHKPDYLRKSQAEREREEREAKNV